MKIFEYIKNVLEYVFGTPGGNLVKVQNGANSVLVKTIYPFNAKGEFDWTQSYANQDLFHVSYMETPYNCVVKKICWYEYKNDSSLFFCINTEDCFLSKSSHYSQVREKIMFIRSEKNISGAREYFLHIRHHVVLNIDEFETITDVLSSSFVGRFSYSLKPTSDIVNIFYTIKIPLRNILSMEFLFQ